MADLLELQGHEFRRSAEYGVRQRIGQSHAKRADMGREHFRLHHRIDGGIAGDDQQADQNEGESHDWIGRRRKHAEDRIGKQRSEDTEADHQRLAADPVGQRTRNRLAQHEDEERRRGDFRGAFLAEAGGVDEEFLQIGRIGIKGERAAGGERHDHQRFPWIVLEQRPSAGLRLVGSASLGIFEGLRLDKAAADIKHRNRQKAANEEGNAPAPGAELFRRQNPLQHQKHRQRQKLTGNKRHILEAGEETAAVLAGHFAEIGCAGAIFAADADALQKPCENQNGRRGNANRLMAGRNRDQQRAETHQRDR